MKYFVTTGNIMQDEFKNRVTYSQMEDLYYEWLEKSFKFRVGDEDFKLEVDTIKEEKLILLGLNKTILEVFPAALIQEDEEQVWQLCKRAARVCIVAGDKICGVADNPFRKAVRPVPKGADEVLQAVVKLTSGLVEAVEIRAKEFK